MSGLTLSTIRAAIKAQLEANLDRQQTVDTEHKGAPAPAIRLFLQESDPIDYWGTFGSTGIAAVRFDLEIDPANADESSQLRLDDYLSVGAGNGSSVVDALMSDKTLGGVVQTLTINSTSYDRDAVTATLSLTVQCKKVGANA